MAIHEEVQTSMAGGFEKDIDEGGITMVYQTLQVSQYQYPIKSTVREILSNGIDSVSEKHVARAILTGAGKVEDYFNTELEGPLYKNSKFNPDYYDLKWLNFQDDQIYMTYITGQNMDKDQVVIRDNGVGLGGERLRGYFNLAYSTKRLSKLPLGKFGLGAKAPLSIGVDFYVMESWYNGRYYKFQIYSKDYFSMIPRFDMDTGRENPFDEWKRKDGTILRVYYLPSEEKNKVQITIEAKKHHKDQYLDAVKSQMLYFSNINLTVVDGPNQIAIPYKANILYEDDLIVMSDNSYYSRPHLLLNKVNYGFIDWAELELSDISGNIGIKVAPEDIEVNPSRESVIWNDKTKEKVLQRFQQVVEIAQKHLEEELKTTDLLHWYTVCQQMLGGDWRNSRNSIVTRLASIVDLSGMVFRFGPAPKIVLGGKHPTPLHAILRMRLVRVEKESKSGVTKTKVTRRYMDWSPSWSTVKVILIEKGTNFNNRKDKYLNTLYTEGFVVVREPYRSSQELNDAKATEEVERFYSKAVSENKISYDTMWDAWENLQKAADVLHYDEIEVPDSFTGTDEEEDVVKEEKPEEVAKATIQRESAEQRRKLEGKILLYTPETVERMVTVTGDTDPVTGSTPVEKRLYQFRKLEVPIKSLNDWEDESKEIYYGTEEDSEMIHLAAAITRPMHHLPSDTYGGRHVERPYATAFDTKTMRTDVDNIKDRFVESKWFRTHQQLLQQLFPANTSLHQSTINGVWYRGAIGLQHFLDTEVMLVKVSRQNTKYLRDFQPVQEFFIQIKNNTVTMSNKLIKWNTARLIKQRLGKCAFLFNYPFNDDLASKYQSLCRYVDMNFRALDAETDKPVYGLRKEALESLVAHLDNVYRFQQAVGQDLPAEELSSIAQDLFGNKELKDGMAVEPWAMDLMQQLEEYAIAVGPLLNYVPVLTGYNGEKALALDFSYVPEEIRRRLTVPNDLMIEVGKFLERKDLLNWGKEEARTPAEPLSAVA